MAAQPGQIREEVADVRAQLEGAVHGFTPQKARAGIALAHEELEGRPVVAFVIGGLTVAAIMAAVILRRRSR
jgi:mitochondrial fission protein ELM1